MKHLLFIVLILILIGCVPKDKRISIKNSNANKWNFSEVDFENMKFSDFDNIQLKVIFCNNPYKDLILNQSIKFLLLEGKYFKIDNANNILIPKDYIGKNIHFELVIKIEQHDKIYNFSRYSATTIDKQDKFLYVAFYPFEESLNSAGFFPSRKANL